MSDNDTLPGFGWVMKLGRWNQIDRTIVGQDGPLPPSRGSRVPAISEPSPANPGRGQLGLMGGTLMQFAGEPQTRIDQYKIYDVMDRTDLAGSVLDMYAEDSTKPDPDVGRAVWVKCKDAKMLDQANRVLSRCRIEEEVMGIARDVAKYGDDFERVVYRGAKSASDTDAGVQRMLTTSPIEMTRKETPEGKLVGFMQAGRKYKGDKSDTSYPWDYVHFRLRGSDRRSMYGTSILKNAVRPWRQMVILEDWMIQYQTSRHPDRNLWVLDGGTSSEADRAETARKFGQKLKRTMIRDPAGASGKQFDYYMNPITPDEDMVMIVSKGSESRIEKLSGSGNAADIVPLKYTLDKFFAAMRVPKAFFGMGESSGVQGDVNMKASLTAQDIRYALTCQRIQRAVRTGLTYLLELHFKLLDAHSPEAVEFDWLQKGKEFSVHMAKVSYLEELERLEFVQLRQQVAVAMSDMARDNPSYRASEWTKYILQKYMGLPENVIDRVLRNADEVLAAQRAILQAKPTDVFTALPAGVGAQTDLAKKEFSLSVDGHELAADQQQHQQKMDKAALAAQKTQESDLVKRAEDAAATARARGQFDHNVSRGEQRMLSEAIARNPKLRHTIELGAIMWQENGDSLIDTGGVGLPDLKADKNLVGVTLESTDLPEILQEITDEVARAGA